MHTQAEAQSSSIVPACHQVASNGCNAGHPAAQPHSGCPCSSAGAYYMIEHDSSAPLIAVDGLRQLRGPDSLDVLNLKHNFLWGGWEVRTLPRSRLTGQQQAGARTVDSLRASRTACRLDRSSWPSMRKSKGSLLSAFYGKVSTSLQQQCTRCLAGHAPVESKEFTI